MQKLVRTFIDPVFCSFGLHTDKQIKSSTGRNPVTTSVGSWVFFSLPGDYFKLSLLLRMNKLRH